MRTILMCCMAMQATTLAESQPELLWPNGPADSNGLQGEEIVRACIGNISIPTLTVYHAPKEIATGAAVIFEEGGHGPSAFDKNPSWEGALDGWLKKRGCLR